MKDGKQKKTRAYFRKDLEKNPYANARKWFEQSSNETVKTVTSRAILSLEDTLKTRKEHIVDKEKIKLTPEFLNIATNNRLKGTKDISDKHSTQFSNDDIALSDSKSNRRYALIDQLILEAWMSRNQETVKLESERENLLGPINRLSAYFSPAGVKALKKLENRTLTDEKTGKKFNELELVADHLCKIVNEAYKEENKEVTGSFFRVTASSNGMEYTESHNLLNNKSQQKDKQKLEDDSQPSPKITPTDVSQHIFDTLLSLAERTPTQQKAPKVRKVYLDDSEKQPASEPQVAQKTYNPRILGKMIAQLDPAIIQDNSKALKRAVGDNALEVSYAVLREYKKAFKHNSVKAELIAENYNFYVMNVLSDTKDSQELDDQIKYFEEADPKKIAEEFKKQNVNINEVGIATALLPYVSLNGVNQINKAQNFENSKKGFIGAFRTFARYMYVKVTETKKFSKQGKVEKKNRILISESIENIIENVPKLQPNQRKDFSTGSSSRQTDQSKSETGEGYEFINPNQHNVEDIDLSQYPNPSNQHGSSNSAPTPGGPASRYSNPQEPRQSFVSKIGSGISGAASAVKDNIKNAATTAGGYAVSTRVGGAILNRVSRTAGDVASVASEVQRRTSPSTSSANSQTNSQSNSTNVSPNGSRRGSMSQSEGVGSSSSTNNLNDSQTSLSDDNDKFINDDQFRMFLKTSIDSFGNARNTREKQDDYERLTYLHKQCMKSKNNNKEMSHKDIEQKRLSQQQSQGRQ